MIDVSDTADLDVSDQLGYRWFACHCPLHLTAHLVSDTETGDVIEISRMGQQLRT